MATLNGNRITIITPSFNQSKYIDEAIQSVLKQNHNNVEHIIIDGGSTDNTVQILKSYEHLIWVSENDRGQADALNKGLALATGDVIGWINSDDYYEENIFDSVMEKFSDIDVQWVIGNLSYKIDATGQIVPNKSLMVNYEMLIQNPDIVKQAPTFFRRDILEHVGGWNADLYMVMDYDLWIRLAKLSTPKMIDENWAHFRLHPDQKTCVSNTQRQLSEIVRVLEKEAVPSAIIIRVYLRKQWFAFKEQVKQLLLKAGLWSFVDRVRIRVKSSKVTS